MIKGIIVSRKSDGLIFCEVMDDEDNDKNFWYVRNQAQEFLKNMNSKENLCTVNIDSQSYIMHYKINENVVYLVITNKKYPPKLAFCFLSEINESLKLGIFKYLSTKSLYNLYVLVGCLQFGKKNLPFSIKQGESQFIGMWIADDI